ncbi:hypothetical protein BDN70DRAFT_921091 [Pholiota conissans]|uniref:Uncharacterized protein n=1 Tax=Pholiota conissans TaxID=109636 RepID=A0A9P6CTQ9_9AGAR|nr:hypothetical protein BDN70DRAFT_921091 [Pholiota conissans]
MAAHPVGLLLSKSFASPYAVSLGLGLGSISYFFWGNLAGQSTAAVFIPVNPEVRTQLGIDISKGVEIWKWGYYRGAVLVLTKQYRAQIHFGISGAASSLAVLAEAFTVPQGSDVTKKYLLLLSGLLLSNAIYTFAIMLPTNNRLVAICKKVEKDRAEAQNPSASPLSAAQEEEVVTLFRKWKNMHYVRIVLGGLGWVVLKLLFYIFSFVHRRTMKVIVAATGT